MQEDNFVPYEPEKRILVELSPIEAHLIKLLRTVDFGDITVFRGRRSVNGIETQTTRVEVKRSIILDAKEGLEIQYKVDNHTPQKYS